MIRVFLLTRHPVLAKQITAGHIDIINDQTGTDELSHHDVHLYRRVKDRAEGEHFRSGRLENFDRGEHGYYDLLHQALNAVVADGFPDSGRLQPRLQVTINQIPHGTGKPTAEGLINIERQKGGSDKAARYSVDLFQSGSGGGQLKVFRSAQIRDFDTTGSSYFALLQACLNRAAGDGFYRRSHG